jgi:hypothetical protein
MPDPASAADSSPMPTPEEHAVDIHKPKPVHSLREFFSEIVVIVCGVLIALALEQGVEAFHWAGKVQEAKTAIHHELMVTTIFAEERIAREQCADIYLADLASAVVASGAQWTPRANSLCGYPSNEVYYGIYRPWPTEHWRSIETEGVVSHFAREYGGRAAFTFDFIKHIGELTNEETQQAGPLDALNYPIALSADARIDFLKTIEKLRRENHLVALLSTQLRKQIANLGETPSASELKLQRSKIPYLFVGPRSDSRPSDF